ncbi:MAG: GntR family transcriptional regulator [Anaerolineaceae bacterium]|nr:GntR family transcriptional regulator [Anaerolineaceae bacterium]
MTLPYSEVDAHSPIPLYHQIYLDLRQIIQQGHIQPGGMLPPEVEICHDYNVGRQTVRQAIARLVDDNIVERFAGRGTFVRNPISLTQFFLDRSFSQQMRELGKTPQTKTLSTESGNLEEDAPPALQPWIGKPYLSLERLRLGDEEPICHQTSTILTERCPGIEATDFEQNSLYEVLASHHHLIIDRIDHIVRAISADDYRADLLDVAKDSPLLLVTTFAYTDNDNLIEYSTSYYRADQYEYSTTQRRCDE